MEKNIYHEKNHLKYYFGTKVNKKIIAKIMKRWDFFSKLKIYESIQNL